MKVKKIIFLSLAFLCFFQLAFGQKAEDVVYLKNHWVLHGRITLKTDTQVSIETKDHNIFVFKTGEIDHISREKVESELNTKMHGFASFIELGPLAARNTSQLNVNTSAFSFQTVNGYKLNQWLFAGLGLGADLYATQTFFPVFGSIRGDLLSKKQYEPYYFVDAGYGFNGTLGNTSAISNKGGALYAVGLGLKIGLSHNAGVLISLGFRTQSYETSFNSITDKATYQRLALRAGFYL
jgi:hypothetical protein